MTIYFNDNTSKHFNPSDIDSLSIYDWERVTLIITDDGEVIFER